MSNIQSASGIATSLPQFSTDLCTDARILSLEQENAALRMHLRLAVESIRNPIPDRFCDSSDEASGEEEDPDYEEGETGFAGGCDDFRDELKLLQEDIISLQEDTTIYSGKSNCNWVREMKVH